MCGPFSTITTDRPAWARRSAGAAAPNPEPMTSTSVRIASMSASSGVVARRRQRGRQERVGVGVGVLGARPEVVTAVEVDQLAAAAVVVDTGVGGDLNEVDRPAVQLAAGAVGRESLLHHGRPVSRAQLIERGAARAAGRAAAPGAPRETRGIWRRESGVVGHAGP